MVYDPSAGWSPSPEGVWRAQAPSGHRGAVVGCVARQSQRGHVVLAGMCG